jgi:hypothetical integral membrane protein (TIGR02206 family)
VRGAAHPSARHSVPAAIASALPAAIASAKRERLSAVLHSAAYDTTVVAMVVVGIASTLFARRRPGPGARWVARVLGALLLADAASWIGAQVAAGRFSPRTSLPLALCDVAAVVAGVACLTRWGLLVELTYFWGLAGTLQALVTPDLNVGFPHLEFFQYVVGHAGIVVAAVYLVAGLRIYPRPHAVPRVLAITAAYTAFVGLIDGLTGADYMFLRQPPANWTLLKVLGPWPWYVLSAAGVGIVLCLVLSVPFRLGSTRRGGSSPEHAEAGSPRVAQVPGHPTELSPRQPAATLRTEA